MSVCLAHLSAQRINLPRQMSLGQSANRRVAGHLADGISVHRQQQSLATHPCCSQRGFDSGMAGTDDNDVVCFG